ncbi:MAG: hypothetical protein ACR2OB_09740, partial [Solirubrobacteraceae bacterium]
MTEFGLLQGGRMHRVHSEALARRVRRRRRAVRAMLSVAAALFALLGLMAPSTADPAGGQAAAGSPGVRPGAQRGMAPTAVAPRPRPTLRAGYG